MYPKVIKSMFTAEETIPEDLYISHLNSKSETGVRNEDMVEENKLSEPPSTVRVRRRRRTINNQSKQKVEEEMKVEEPLEDN